MIMCATRFVSVTLILLLLPVLLAAQELPRDELRKEIARSKADRFSGLQMGVYVGGKPGGIGRIPCARQGTGSGTGHRVCLAVERWGQQGEQPEQHSGACSVDRYSVGN